MADRLATHESRCVISIAFTEEQCAGCWEWNETAVDASVDMRQSYVGVRDFR